MANGIGAYTASYDEVDWDDSPLGTNIKGAYSVSYGDGSKGGSPFTVPPVVTVTCDLGDDTSTATRIATLLDADEDGFIVYISNSKGDDEQCPFYFTAIGTISS